MGDRATLCSVRDLQLQLQLQLYPRRARLADPRAPINRCL